MPTTALLFVAYTTLGFGAESIEFVGGFAERAAKIVKHPTVHTSTAWESIDADLGLFEWLIDHPSAAATLWSEIGLPVGTVDLLADGWRSRDPDGVTLEFHRIHQSSGLRGYYCKATAPTGAIPRTVTAEFVMIHQVGATVPAVGGQPIDRLEAWVSAEGAALRMLMKLVNGAATNIVVRSLRETKLYFTLAAKIAERRPQWAKSALAKRPGVLATTDLAQFDKLVQSAAQRPVARASTTSKPASLSQTTKTTTR